MFLLVFLYDLFIQLYFFAAWLASFFNPKAYRFINGREETWLKLNAVSLKAEKRYWFHCASLGEFEQARPLIALLKKNEKDCFIAVSFFSPSGYEIRKNFPLADVVFYLPKDTKANAEKLIQFLRPTQVFWIKYEFWYHILDALKTHNIPTYLVCAHFRTKQVFFQWYGAFFRKTCSFFTTIFTQDESSKKLLNEINISAVVAGDTRFDRVIEIAQQAKSIPEIDQFAQGKKLLIAGSTWNTDVQLLANSLDEPFFEEYKLVLVPHDILEKSVSFAEDKFAGKTTRFSEKENLNLNAQILILDTTGLLSSAYRYGAIAYIGGGFGASVHNVLEAAVYGLPTIFGTNYQKSREAIELIELHAAKSIRNADELKSAIQLFQNKENWKRSSERAKNYVQENSGAAAKILSTFAL